MPYFDVHTHSATPNGIVNCYPEDELPESYFSVGIHPWYISDLNQQLALVEEKAKHKNCLAIGECGLDTFSEVDIKLQKIAFRQQIQLANQLNKPLIIHLVKAHTEFFEILKQIEPKVPVILHGFNKKPEVMQQFNRPGFYLSFGEALLKENSKASESLKELGTENYFLETDDSSISIEEVYLQAASVLDISVEALQHLVQKRIESIFHARF